MIGLLIKMYFSLWWSYAKFKKTPTSAASLVLTMFQSLMTFGADKAVPDTNFRSFITHVMLQCAFLIEPLAESFAFSKASCTASEDKSARRTHITLADCCTISGNGTSQSQQQCTNAINVETLAMPLT